MIFELMTATAFSVGTIAMPSRAQSATAQYLEQKTDEQYNHLRKTATFSGGKSFDELLMVYQECQLENWDGYGALPVSNDTHTFAKNFLKVLPLGIKMPSIGAEPDGHLTLEWYQSVHQILSLSISPDGIIHYAALLGGSSEYGSEPFTGKVSGTILNLIKRIPTT